jgi:hypothetical protein
MVKHASGGNSSGSWPPFMCQLVAASFVRSSKKSARCKRATSVNHATHKDGPPELPFGCHPQGARILCFHPTLASFIPPCSRPNPMLGGGHVQYLGPHQNMPEQCVWMSHQLRFLDTHHAARQIPKPLSGWVPFYASESEDELLIACGPCASRLKPQARPTQLSGKKLSRILGWTAGFHDGFHDDSRPKAMEESREETLCDRKQKESLWMYIFVYMWFLQFWMSSSEALRDR